VALELNERVDKVDKTVAVLELIGDLDAETAAFIEERTVALTRKGITRLIFDFLRLKNIGFSGVGVFMVVDEILESVGGTLTVVNASEDAISKFGDFGIERLCMMFTDVEDALSGFRQ